MRKILTTGFILFIFTSVSFAQKKIYNDRKLASAVFEKDDVYLSKFYRSKLVKGDSSCLNEYAASLFRLHQFSQSYLQYKISHKKNQVTNPLHIMEFIQLSHIFDSAGATMINSHYEKMLLASGYKNIPVNNSTFLYAAIHPAAFNSDADDFGVCETGGKVLFASTRKKVEQNIENSFVRIYTVTDSAETKAVEFKKGNDWLGFIGDFNTKFHFGPINISKDKTKIFVTASRQEVSKSGVNTLTIFESHLEGKNYSDLKVIPFDNVEYSFEHPFYDDPSGYLYFSSNMPGGAGGYDIYKVKFDGKEWGTPENISYINSAASEVFPSLDEAGNLYYSGKTVNGFGGLDIIRLEKGKTTPELLGYPFNSPYDDFNLIVTNSKHGYFCSNRTESKGGDNIYQYTIQLPLYHVSLIVKDWLTREKIKEMEVEGKLKAVSKFTNKFIDTIVMANSNDTGSIVMAFPGDLFGTICNVDFKLRKKGYDTHTSSSSISFGEDRTIYIEKFLRKEEGLEIKKIAKKIKVGVDLGKVLKLNPIYFDLDKSDIREDAAFELDKIVEAMKEMPTLVIELGSHTDSRGSKTSNQQLSDKRAESSGKYILSRGIDPGRLTWKGYGDTKLLNKCKKGVKCSEEEHAVNRRTEFKIVKM
ncbi:MAG: OmpA family protein [Bacteroidia bacterium]